MFVIAAWLSCCVISFFFFFQAEDGIRDDLVTGVQTCALPIYRLEVDLDLDLVADQDAVRDRHVPGEAEVRPIDRQRGGRSEERRVGKEWRCGGWRYQ